MDLLTKNLGDFIDASPSAFHAADNILSYLTARGAILLDEKSGWQLEPGVCYCVARGSSVFAFKPGFSPMGESGFLLAGAHTDSPGLKIRPHVEKPGRGFVRLAVEVYGGAILAGWLDRPLSLAGRILVRNESGARELLYASHRPIGVIPSLPIHLNRDINKGFEHNAHSHLPVIVDILEAGEGKVEPGKEKRYSWIAGLIARDLDLSVDDIIGVELFFHDGQKTMVFGKEGTLLNAPRLDDLAGCHAVMQAFSDSAPAAHTQAACFLDAEEIGSMTAQGADSNFVRDMLARIHLGSNKPAEDFYRAGARSLFVSVDAAQAWNPAYPEKYDEGYSPLLGKGPAIKTNANQRYATDLISETLYIRACEASSQPWQRYMARSDIQPGTTIGPITASRLGIRTVDIGHPLLSMHAIRETLHIDDHRALIASLQSLYSEIPRI